MINVEEARSKARWQETLSLQEPKDLKHPLLFLQAVSREWIGSGAAVTGTGAVAVPQPGPWMDFMQYYIGT